MCFGGFSLSTYIHHCIQHSTVTMGNVPPVGALLCGYNADHPTAEDCSYRITGQLPPTCLRFTEHTQIRTRVEIQISETEDILMDNFKWRMLFSFFFVKGTLSVIFDFLSMTCLLVFIIMISNRRVLHVQKDACWLLSISHFIYTKPQRWQWDKSKK